MARHRPWKRYACAAHTQEVVARLKPLVPCLEEEGPIEPAELADWISVEAEDDPEVDEHGWWIGLDDAVGLLVHPDRDDLPEALEEQAGVRSVVQLDREVLVMRAPQLCADGVKAAVMLAVARANEQAHRPQAERRPRPSVPGLRGGASADFAQPSTDDQAPGLVDGNARWQGRTVQLWVAQDGILILPAGTIPHGPLDSGENLHFQRASFTAAQAARLAEQHSGRWIPVSPLSRVSLHQPVRLPGRWTATITERNGPPVCLSWRGTRQRALLLWLYHRACHDLGPADGPP